MSKFSDTLNPEDVKLLLMARDQILAAPPERFDMGDWTSKRPRGCGAAFCLCGHMAVLDNPRIAKMTAYLALTEVNCWRLNRGLADTNNDAWWRLFSYPRWPVEFKHYDTQARDVLAERIDHWLETGE